MARFEQRHETPKWRTFWLLVAFTLLIGIGVVTVLLPELEDQPIEPAKNGETVEPGGDPQE